MGIVVAVLHSQEGKEDAIAGKAILAGKWQRTLLSQARFLALFGSEK